MVEIGVRAILIKVSKKTLFTFRSKSVSDGIQFRFENRENGIGVSVSVWDRKNPIRAFERRRRSPGKSLPTVSLSPRLVRAFPPPKIYRLSARFQLKASRSRIFSLIGFNRNIGGRLHGCLHGCSEQM